MAKRVRATHASPPPLAPKLPEPSDDDYTNDAAKRRRIISIRDQGKVLLSLFDLEADLKEEMGMLRHLLQKTTIKKQEAERFFDRLCKETSFPDFVPGMSYGPEICLEEQYSTSELEEEPVPPSAPPPDSPPPVAATQASGYSTGSCDSDTIVIPSSPEL